MMQATIPLESLMIPLMSLSNQDKLWIADRLYREVENDSQLHVVDHSTMPGQFSEEEKRQRILQSYSSTNGSTVEEVEAMLLSL